MSGRRKQLKEQIARTQDPLVRIQLGTLLNAKGRRRGGIVHRIENALDSVLGPAISRWPAGVPLVLFAIVLTIIVLVIFVVLECMTPV
jgi:hypothetical protein